MIELRSRNGSDGTAGRATAPRGTPLAVLPPAEARRDPVSGLATRSALIERLDATLRQAASAQRGLSLIVFGLDDFARFCATARHRDAVVAQVARTANRVLRAGEELFRVGDDEFAVVIGGSAEACRRVVERVQAALSAQTRGGPLPTISAGVATYPLDGRETAELLAVANEALHASKQEHEH